MPHSTFSDFINHKYNFEGSRTARSYLTSIEIMNDLFAANDIFGLNGKSLDLIDDPLLIAQIVDFINAEATKFKKNLPSFFDNIRPEQTSYAKGGFCRAAIRQLGEWIDSKVNQEVSQMVIECPNDGKRLSKQISRRFNLNRSTTEKEVLAKHRLGQNIFRDILLNIYNTRCCVLGLEIREVLRASHIIPWSEYEENRLYPSNGLCLSATYDAAFDKHLISFDEDYKMILSPTLRDRCTPEAFRTHFLHFEGKQISMPSSYLPSQAFLQAHREQSVV